MTGDEVTYLLSLIAACDRKPFPAGAEAGWLMVLEGVELGDALEAVKRHYSAPNPRPITPGDVRAAAINERDRNLRLERMALPAAPVVCTNRAERVAEISTMLAEKFGNLDRAPVQRRRADVSSPIVSTANPDEYEAERARQLRLLDSLSLA